MDAVSVARAFAPARLTQARELAGLRKRELAEAIGRTATAVSQYELGQTGPAAETLLRCARALDVPVAFFAAGRAQLRLDTVHAHFSSLRDSTAVARRHALAQVELLWEIAEALDQIVELPQADIGLPLGIPHGDPAVVARRVRKAWHLPGGPVVHLVRTLEARGIVVTWLRAVDGGPGAFSTAPHGRPMIVLSGMENPLCRRFSVAHELGHLLLHPDPEPGSTRHERQASAFAAELLMPAAEIPGRLPVPVDLAALKDTADGYGVSVTALVKRGKELGVYPESTLRRTLAAIRRLGWHSHEPVRSGYPGELPALLPNAVEVAAAHGLPLAVLAGRLRLSPRRLRALIGLPDSRPALRLVQCRHDDKPA
jgi:Zn-dependent peptidase ImmA (M78 family)/DNA-binding XRE family transcriptional regulator